MSVATKETRAVARWLLERRRATGKSQAAIAAEIGVGKRSVERWEKGEHIEHVVTVLRLLSAFGYDLDEADRLPTSVSAELAELRRVVAASAAGLRVLVTQLPGGEAALAELEAQERDRASE